MTYISTKGYYNCINIAKAKSKGMPLNSFNNQTKLSTYVSAAAASAISAIAVANMSKTLSVKDVEKKLIEIGYTKDKNGVLNRKLTEEQKTKIEKDYAELYYRDGISKIPMYKTIENFYETPIYPIEIKNYIQFIGMDKKQGMDVFKNNFEKSFKVFQNITQNGYSYENLKNNKNIYQMVINYIKTEDNDPVNTTITLEDYKYDCNGGVANYAQELLRTGKFEHEKFWLDTGRLTKEQIEKLKQKTTEYANNLADIIDKQIVPEGLILYRGDGYKSLSEVKLDNGKSVDLGAMMNAAKNSGNKNEIDKIKEFVLDNEITAVQPGFLSTSVSKDGVQEFTGGGILWKLQPEPGTKGHYMEITNLTGSFPKEQEILLQKGSKMKIQDINFDSKNGFWIINAKVSN